MRPDDIRDQDFVVTKQLFTPEECEQIFLGSAERIRQLTDEYAAQAAKLEEKNKAVAGAPFCVRCGKRTQRFRSSDGLYDSKTGEPRHEFRCTTAGCQEACWDSPEGCTYKGFWRPRCTKCESEPAGYMD